MTTVTVRSHHDELEEHRGGRQEDVNDVQDVHVLLDHNGAEENVVVGGEDGLVVAHDGGIGSGGQVRVDLVPGDGEEAAVRKRGAGGEVHLRDLHVRVSD